MVRQSRQKRRMARYLGLSADGSRAWYRVAVTIASICN